MADIESLPMFDDVGPVLPRREDELAGLSPGRRRTIRRLWKIAEGIHPITGAPLHPEAPKDATRWDRIAQRPFTCGSCAHRFTNWGGAKTYPKCDLHISRSEFTDVPAWLPACSSYVSTEDRKPA
jgi:hypothetical protein